MNDAHFMVKPDDHPMTSEFWLRYRDRFTIKTSPLAFQPAYGNLLDYTHAEVRQLRLATVPHWLFGLMIFGWLAIMGIAGTVSQADRFWNYYRVASNRWMRQNNRAQSQAIIQQFLNQQPGGAGGGVGLLPSSPTGALATPVMPPMPTLAESLYNYFFALMAQEQVSCLIFMASATVGLGGLALIPVSRRCSPRFNTGFVALGSMLFGLLALNYLYGYVMLWTRRF